MEGDTLREDPGFLPLAVVVVAIPASNLTLYNDNLLHGTLINITIQVNAPAMT
jgi:hypothetical protein